MGWEQRGKKKYFYRSRWANGRVVREYLGSGPDAEAAAKRAAEFRRWKKEYDEEVAELDKLDNLVNMIVEATMLNAGYHKPNRGPWRKKRIKKGEAMSTPAEPQAPAPDAPLDEDAWNRACDSIIQQAQAGDYKALEPLRVLMSRRPETVLMCGGDVAWEAVRLRTRIYAGTDLARREAVHQRLAAMYQELCGDNPQPKGVERLLIERIISTWLHLYTRELDAARVDTARAEPNLTYEAALSAAQRRFLSALEALTTMRQHALPPMQINVAHKQVNVAGNVG